MKHSKNKRRQFRLDLTALLLSLLLMQMIPASGQSPIEKGIGIFEDGNYYGAERFFTAYTENHPDDALGYYYLGRVYNATGKLKEAAGRFDKAVGLAPESSPIHTWRGINYIQLLSEVDFLKQGLYASRAQNSLESAVALDSSNIEARVWLAGYYANAPSFAGGSREKMEEQFEAVFRMDPDNKGALLQHGIFLTQFEDYDRAMDSFNRLLKLDNAFFPAYLHIGKLSAESGKFLTRGEMALLKFTGEAGDDFEDSMAEAWHLLGEIHLHRDEPQQARRAFEKAVKLDLENKEYRRSLENIL